jgi:hypothetical protein
MPGWQKPPQPARPNPAPTRKTSTDRGRAQPIPDRHTGRPGAAWLHRCARTAGVRPRAATRTYAAASHLLVRLAAGT